MTTSLLWKFSTLLLVVALFSSCASLKSQQSKLALSNCAVELISATPRLEEMKPLLRVPLKDGGERVHDLTRPSLGLLVDLPLLQEGLAYWEIQNLLIDMQLKLQNKGRRDFWLDSLLITLDFDRCSLPLQAIERVHLKRGDPFLHTSPVVTTLKQDILDCAFRADSLKTKLVAKVLWSEEDPEPVYVSFKESRPFPKEELDQLIEEAGKGALLQLFGY